MKSPENSPYPIGEYDELIKDKIPDRIKSSGLVPVTHVSHGEEYARRLQSELRGEVNKLFLSQTKDEAIRSLADVLEVIRAYTQLVGVEMRVIEAYRQAELTSEGGFARGFVLERVEKPVKRTS